MAPQNFSVNEVREIMVNGPEDEVFDDESVSDIETESDNSGNSSGSEAEFGESIDGFSKYACLVTGCIKNILI